MPLAPFHVLEDEVFVSYQSFYLLDNEGILCFLFVGDSCNLARDVGHGVRVMSTASDHYASVRLEAWTNEPPLQTDLWSEKCDILLDWTSGTVLLNGGVISGSGQLFTFAQSSSTASDDYPTPDDYRLRIYHRYQPQFAVMFPITTQDHDTNEEAKDDIVAEDDDFPHHMERCLFQFWPVPSTREILVDDTVLETYPRPRLTPRRVKEGQSIFSLSRQL